VVVMRRMPDARRLSLLTSRGDEARPCIDRLAELMARFHAGAPTGGEIDDAATRDAVARLWERELAEYPAAVPNVAHLVGRFLAGRAPLFDDRIRAGRARDGHGDLLADDVFCLADGPRVLDCLEFDERLRFGDVLADISFLAMDLERLGRRDLAERFLERSRAAASDDWPSSLAHFYIAYRAHVRAKIAAIAGDDDTSGSLLALAHDHLDRGRVRLVLVGGPPATGKTTVAREIAAATGWPVIRSDEVRKDLAGVMQSDRSAAPLDEGLYAPEWTERTYATLCERARIVLTNGSSIVLDASWGSGQWRAMAADAAEETASDLIALQCDAPIDVAMARAAQREAAHADASDADASIAAAAAARFERWPGAHRLDTTKAPADVMREVLLEVGQI
ncbi:MAG TPA: AAA family ATPase, partial [Acidimicrobiia bacterium]|nr:AAA family ATPase [Acidimicrobiia bacterium]